MDKRFATGKVKEINIESRTLAAYASTRDVDRDGEVILPEAWRETIQEFSSVPLLWAHDYRIPPIGKAQNFEIDERGLKFTAQFANTEFANEIWGLYRDGFLNSFSVGFQPKQWRDEEGSGIHRTFIEAELMEVSGVPVPANPYATVERGVPVLSIKSLDKFTLSADVQDAADSDPPVTDPPATEPPPADPPTVEPPPAEPEPEPLADDTTEDTTEAQLAQVLSQFVSTIQEILQHE